MKSRAWLPHVLMFIAISLGFSTCIFAQTRYTVTDMGTLGGSLSIPCAINDSIEIAGWSQSPGGDRPFLWKSGVMLALPTMGGTGYAYDINEQGQICGICYTNIGGPIYSRASLWTNGVLTNLGAMGGTDSTAYGMNNNGQIVGKYRNLAGKDFGFLWKNGVVTNLDLFGVDSTYLGDINDSGEVTGAGGPVSFWTACLWDQVNGMRIIVPATSYGESINSYGHVTGFLSAGGTLHAYIWTNGVVTDLGTLGGRSDGYGINDAGQVVGRYGSFGNFRACLWEAGSIIDLNDQIDPASGYVLEQAKDINNLGYIVCIGTIGGETHALLLSPMVATLSIAGSPSLRGQPQALVYGNHTVMLDEIVTNSVTTPADATNGTRYVCTGWTGTESVPVSGNSNTVVFVITTNSTLTWNWETEYYLGLSATNGAITGATNGWKANGWVYDLNPTNDLGYLFDHWEINGTNAGTNIPLSLTMSEPKNVAAVFTVNFIDVTGITDTSFDAWSLSRQTGTYFGTLRLTNKIGSGKKLRDKFWYAVESSSNLRLMHPDGVTVDGKQYVDITAKVEAALPGVGNGDLVLDPGETVLVNSIEFYSRDRSTPSGFTLAVWADPPGDSTPDMSKRDTDGDGVPNEWEDAHGLNKNNPSDGHSANEWGFLRID